MRTDEVFAVERRVVLQHVEMVSECGGQYQGAERKQMMAELS